ncbi:MAG: U32 family peptidase [Methanospirillaceae archaeon]|nr:U32 family peptidase [Methanospirillaceae archaeon]
MRAKNAGPVLLPELLAPAGSWDCLISAIAAGADAVYAGGQAFGARQFAPNFDRETLKKAVLFAHLHDVRIYITVNTLVSEDELEKVAEYLFFLYTIGADAILIQDTGILALAKRIIPQMPVHASTQMTLHSVAGAQWAAKMGCLRIVLPRELIMDEVRLIREGTLDYNLGLEVFVHGALCYGWSGQCLLSSVIGGRSGNRGMCAQPCRKPYELVTGIPDEYGRLVSATPLKTSDTYLLSTRDLCCYEILDQICSLPVVSLKIEGRMRSPGYVATVVSCYRKALDTVAESCFLSQKEDIQALSLSFSRGFTTGYLAMNESSDVMGRDMPGDRGILVGTVSDRAGTGGVYVRGQGLDHLCAGDGLVSLHGSEEQGLVLRSDCPCVKGEFLIPFKPPCVAGDPVYLTSRRAYTASAEQIIKQAGLYCKKIPLDLFLQVNHDGVITGEGKITSRIAGTALFQFTSTIIMVPAEKKPVTRDFLITQIKKTGNTPFIIRSFSLIYDGGLFAPVRMINEIKREIIAKAEETLHASCTPDTTRVTCAESRLNHLLQSDFFRVLSSNNTTESPDIPLPRLIVLTDSIPSARAALTANADIISFEFLHLPDRDEINRFFMEWTTEKDRFGSELYVKLPRILREKDSARFFSYLPFLVRTGIGGVMVDSHGPADRIALAAPTLDRIGYYGLPVCNHMAVSVLAECLSMVTISPELTLDQISSLAQAVPDAGIPCALGILVQGSIEALISSDLLLSCMGCDNSPDPVSAERVYGIRDEKNRIFLIREDPLHHTRIYNSAETTLIDYLPRLYRCGISSFIIDARGRPPGYVSLMIGVYRAAIQKLPDEKQFIRDLKDAKREIAKGVQGGMTAAAITRGW